MKRVIGILLSSMLMSACGGGGGSGGTSGGTSSVKSSVVSVSSLSSVASVSSSSSVSSESTISSSLSSSSSSSLSSPASSSSSSISSVSSSSSSSLRSSSSSSSVGACNGEGVIFSECLNAEWGAFQVYEEDVQTYAGQIYTQETNDSNLQWKVINSPVAGRGKVVELTYGQKAGVGSTLQLRSVSTQNRTAYDTGKLVFDLNVVNFGESYNSTTGNAIFELVLECVWPCTSHSAFFPVSFENVWQTIEINIVDLIRDGLDTSKIDTAFMIRPVFENASQKGVVLQLDNIKWVKSSGSAPKSKDIYSEHFNTNASLDQWVFATYGGGMDEITKYLSQGLGLYPIWVTDFDHWAMETELSKAINIRNKKASFQIKLADALVGASGTSIGFSVVATDSNARQVESDMLTSAGMTGKQWHEFEIQLGSSFPNGFNAADVRKLAIHFYANGKPTYIHGAIQIDTIRITE
ncbi:MAG: hypothetical protein AAGC78_20005 [Cellvibrio sp.]|uniref:hypothetical protein n=1 Tax=Cellvibrio sp. TaxID=1965322 RepID=UPI0031A62F74